MRGALLLLLGVASGIVGAVLLFTVTDTFDTGGPDDSGGGNARVEIHEDALAMLIRNRLEAVMPVDTPVETTVSVLDSGRLEVHILVGEPALGDSSVLELDPEVVEGALDFTVVSSELNGLPEEAQPIDILTSLLTAQMDALAGGLPYRLVAITTHNGKLTLDIVV